MPACATRCGRKSSSSISASAPRPSTSLTTSKRRSRSATSFVAGFVGDPPMSLAHARLAEESGQPVLRLAGATLPLPERLAGQARAAVSPEVLVGLRPQHLTLAERPGE